MFQNNYKSSKIINGSVKYENRNKKNMSHPPSTTYEDFLNRTTLDATKLSIMLHFRQQYGWEKHHPYHCCEGQHACDRDMSESMKTLPIMTATELQYILNKPEREKEEYKKRIFL